MRAKHHLRKAAALILLLTFLFPLCSFAHESTPFRFALSVMEMYIGSELRLAEQLPAGVRDENILYASSDPSVAEVDSSGLVRIVGEGRAELTAETSDGRTAALSLRAVDPVPARRALLLSEQRYADGRMRTGAVNTVQGLSDMLGSLRYRSGTPFEITARIDSTPDDIRAAIDEAFAGSQEDDVNLFYIGCHGEMVDGEPCILLHDGSALSVRELEKMLRPVPGRMVVLLDFCQSGAFIGRSADPHFAQSALQIFSNTALLNGKYLVMTSCGADEESYRLSDSGENTENAMSTVFARALCEGLGWDLDKDRSVSLRADTDRDGAVTFTELWLYAKRRVYYHLSGTGAVQNVMAWPEMNEAELFARLLG